VPIVDPIPWLDAVAPRSLAVERDGHFSHLQRVDTPVGFLIHIVVRAAVRRTFAVATEAGS